MGGVNSRKNIIFVPKTVQTKIPFHATFEIMAKTITTLTLIFCLLTISLTVEAQQRVTGQVTQELDGTPLPFATVFIAGTTIGAQTDIDGNFSITVPIQGNFEIVVSHLGFLPVFHTVDAPQPYHQINFALQERIDVLTEIVVIPCLPHGRREEDFFWRTILGERPSRRGMQVLNPEVVQFCLRDNGILRAFADEPIEIINHTMGYHILYVLEGFEHDNRNDVTVFSGMPLFTELTPESNRQSNRWERRRQAAYSISLTRFIRSLYQEQLYENGFFLAKRDPMEQNRMIELSFSREDSIRLGIPLREAATTEASFSLNHILHRDEEATRVNIEQPLLMALLSRPVTLAMFSNPNRIFFGRNERHPLVRLLPSDITIFPDGSYSGVLNIREYRGSILGLRTILPMEFRLSEDEKQPTIFTARNSFPLETIYVQTDKQTYFTGENIWFRAYLLNSQTHVQDTLSRYVYAELINSQREVVHRVKIRHENGVFAGHIPVTEDLEAGAYNLRFFTRHLGNFGEEYFFHRVIHIITPQSLEERRLSEQVREDDLPEERAPAPIPAESFSVSFHPEGGDIPIGVETLIAFKAINSNGLGEHIHGVIVNERGDTITYFESAHLGMGYFLLMANSDERFFAICRNATGVEKTFELPRAKENAISLQIFRYAGNVIVHLPKPQTQNRVLYLTVKNRGDGISERWNNESEFLLIPQDDLPTGVIGIILSDSQGIPISKRQIFNTNNTETVNTTFTTKNETHNTRERVNATVTVTDSEGKPLWANFSISVIDNDIAHYDASVNILSTLLLTSELRGHIENPAYYFMTENENAKEHLDLVMLTHGWTRFDVSRVYDVAWQNYFETSQSITGRVQRDLIGGFFRGRANQQVTLLSTEYAFFDVVYTDREGRFRFENFEFPNGTEFLLKSREGTEIFIDDVGFPDVNNFVTPTKNNMPVLDSEQIEDIQRFISEDVTWSLELDEFVVVARQEQRPFTRMVRRENLDRIWDGRVISVGRLLLYTSAAMRLVDLESEDGRVFRDVPANERGAPIVVYIDGINIPNEFMRETMLIMGSVVSIEVTERFSIEMASITTSRSFGRFIHQARIFPLGYQITQEFFSPAYTTPEQRANKVTDLRRTIYWNPSVTTGENGKAEIYFSV